MKISQFLFKYFNVENIGNKHVSVTFYSFNLQMTFLSAYFIPEFIHIPIHILELQF